MRSAALWGGTLIVALAAGTARAGTVLDFQVTIDDSQETSDADSTATGTGTVTLDTGNNLLSWDITYQNLTGPLTVAHFHGPAPICSPASPLVTISNGGAASGSLMGSAFITAQQADDLRAGLWYVNLHTSLFPPGEIRGQVVPGPLLDPLPPIAQSTVHIRLELVADGLTAPNWGAVAPGDAGRLFVTDQDGILWAIDLASGDKTVFLDVSPLLVDLGVFGPGTFDERGLLGVAFHPQYQTNGLLYTYTSEHVFKPADFSTMPPGMLPDHRSVIREWQVPDPGDPDSVVDPTTARALLRIDEPQFNHNAGGLNFGPDGLLYISLGDGGGADDQDGQPFIGGLPLVGHGCDGNGQNTGSVLGKILRIDPLGNDSANGEYGIPAGNPFVGMKGVVEEIFAYGFRNPFRFSFDSLTGDLYVGDVGQNHVEEVDIVLSGGNYGWHVREGTLSFVPNGAESGYATGEDLAAPEGLIGPIAQYDHDDGLAIIGGFVYRGTKIPALAGRYVFGEFSRTFSNDGRLFHLDDGNEILEFQLVGQDAFGLSLLGMGRDAAGELYALANATGTPFESTGVVLRISVKPGDLDADGDVDVTDLLDLLAAWNQSGGAADLDMDGTVGVGDLLILLANFGL